MVWVGAPSGSKMKSKAPLIVGILKRIADENNGLLLPEMVVEAARPLNSPLHSKFEWSNTKAANAYRLEQARRLIRVSVEIIPQSKKPTDVFVSLSTDRRKGGYRVVTEVLSNAQMRAQMLSDALAEMELFRAKYADLRELSMVFAAIRKVSKRKR